MPATIGPDFGNEIAAAGLLGLPFSWTAEGVEYGAALTAPQQASLAAVVAAHNPTKPDIIASAAAALGAGLKITSAGTPAIDGTFAVDAAMQAKIAAVEVYILKNGAFPGDAASYGWPLLGGGMVVFPGIAVFQAWATAIADYVASLDVIIATVAGALPAASSSIS